MGKDPMQEINVSEYFNYRDRTGHWETIGNQTRIHMVCAVNLPDEASANKDHPMNQIPQQ